MEDLARKYLTNVEISDDYITGTLDNETDYNNLLTDIDTISGGFVKKWTKGNEVGKEEGNKFVICYMYMLNNCTKSMPASYSIN